MAAILLIEDSETHRAEIAAALAASGLFESVVEASDGLAGLQLLMRAPVDVVLCDLEMPGLDGEKLLRAREASPRCADVPFLFLTGSADLERRARLLEDGAADVIAKPFHASELVARVRKQLKIKRLHDELRDKHATLARLSTVDPLTGLRTRRYVQERLSIEFLRAERYGVAMAVILADVDHFKRVNDRWGHPTGDCVLKGVAGLLLPQLRATDAAGRWGGEEFLIVLSHNDAAGARALAERWRNAVAATAFEPADGGEVSVTLSLGIAQHCAAFASPDDLVACADAALYRAKQSGRNCTLDGCEA